MVANLVFFFILLAVDSNELFPPEFPFEIKDGQWMGVTVKSQRPGGKVLVSNTYSFLNFFRNDFFLFKIGFFFLIKKK